MIFAAGSARLFKAGIRAAEITVDIAAAAHQFKVMSDHSNLLDYSDAASVCPIPIVRMPHSNNSA